MQDTDATQYLQFELSMDFSGSVVATDRMLELVSRKGSGVRRRNGEAGENKNKGIEGSV